jgi:hypothetical protein
MGITFLIYAFLFMPTFSGTQLDVNKVLVYILNNAKINNSWKDKAASVVIIKHGQYRQYYVQDRE